MKTLRMLYLVFANTLVLCFVILLATQCLILLRDRNWTSSEYLRLPEVVKKNYAHMTPADVDELLAEHSLPLLRYESWVGFGVAAHASKFLNVNEFGIRSNGEPRRDMQSIDNAIWFFGGSTTFGSGISDQETIPAQLEKALVKPVVNFGVPTFYSAQEDMLLAQYLKSGYRPALVLFLDGVNEVCDISEYQAEMKALFAKAQTYTWDLSDVAKPMVVALARTRAKLGRLLNGGLDAPIGDRLFCQNHGAKVPLRDVHSRTLAERESLCRSYAVECITLVQPFGGVHGRNEDPTYSADDRKSMRDQFLNLEPGWRAAQAVFVTESLDQLMKHAYIDDVHYSAEASKVIAKAIADKIRGTTR